MYKIKSVVVTRATSGQVSLAVDGQPDVICPIPDVAVQLKNHFDLIQVSGLQFLTSMEADTLLTRLVDRLAVNGRIHITVPDLDHIANLWLNAEWDEGTLRDVTSVARQSFLGLFGPQLDGNPMLPGYSIQYEGCYKSGYNHKRLSFLLARLGLVDINIANDDSHILKASARQSMVRGERQVAPDLRNIRKDHLNRYQFAADNLRAFAPKRVLDLACGIGYGSQLLAHQLETAITSVDIEPEAIAYAKQHYGSAKITHVCADARTIQLDAASFDAIVSFETIEHVTFDEALLCQFNRWLRDGGKLVISTPNESVMPFNIEQFPYHVKHYTYMELESMLARCGFRLLQVCKQEDLQHPEIVLGHDGCFIIVAAEKM